MELWFLGPIKNRFGVKLAHETGGWPGKKPYTTKGYRTGRAKGSDMTGLAAHSFAGSAND